jgi:hypothetical protein
MKLLFALSNGSCPYIIEASKKLLNIKGVKLAFYCTGPISKNNLGNLKNFVKKNKFKIYFYNNINDNFINIDNKYLDYIENNLNINLWKCISVDRSLGRGYIQDLYGYKSDYNSNDEIISVAIKKLKNIEKTLLKFKPNVVYWPTAVASFEAVIFDKLCSNLKIEFITSSPFRIKNFYYYARNMYYNYPNIENIFQKYKIKKKNINSINKLYKEITMPGKLSSDAEYVSNVISRLNQNILKSIYIFLVFFFKHSVAFLLYFLNFKIFKLSYHARYEFLSPVLEKYKLLSAFHFLKKYKYNNLNCDYIYYPLHRTPEGSTQLNGNTFMDQFFLIQSLSKNLPINYKLLVKEHPSMIEAHSRGNKFYKEISKLPNVEVVDFRLSGTEIVKRAKLTVVLDGSSAVEAMLLGVPVLTMANFFYSFLGLSIENINFSNLNRDIIDAINLKNIHKKLKEKKIKKLLHIISEKGFNLREPDTFYYMSKKFSEKSFKTTGDDVYNSLVTELRLK